jgi:hypothetical protein
MAPNREEIEEWQLWKDIDKYRGLVTTWPENKEESNLQWYIRLRTLCFSKRNRIRVAKFPELPSWWPSTGFSISTLPRLILWLSNYAIIFFRDNFLQFLTVFWLLRFSTTTTRLSCSYSLLCSDKPESRDSINVW